MKFLIIYRLKAILCSFHSVLKKMVLVTSKTAQRSEGKDYDGRLVIRPIDK